MQQFFDQLLRFLQQGIAAIFRFVELIWGWSVAQISSLTRVPWQDWPLWKQMFLVLIMLGVVYALYKVAVELWEAGERILAAFATLLGVLVRTLPSVMIAGLVALGGLWVLNNVDFSKFACRLSCRRLRSIVSSLPAFPDNHRVGGGYRFPEISSGAAVRRLLGGAPFTVCLARLRRGVAHHQFRRELTQRLAGLARILGPVGSRPRAEMRCRLQRGGARDDLVEAGQLGVLAQPALVLRILERGFVLHADDDAQAFGKAHVRVALAELAEELQAGVEM